MSIVPKNKTLLEEMRALLRRQGYAYGTENTYCDWVRRFVKFSNVQSRIEMLENAEQKVERFLTHLAIKQKVAPSTQNQALNALVFLYTKVLKQPLEGVNAARSRKEPRIPVVMSKKEVAKV
jgi:site-specific recombinase XerD